MNPRSLDTDYARDLLKIHGSIRAAARATPHSFGAIRNAIQRGQSFKQPVQDPDIEEWRRQNYNLQQEIKSLRGQLESERRESYTAERIREKVYELANSPVTPPAWMQERSIQPGVPGIPVTLWSDWHWAEVVDPIEVGGVNEFNSVIAAQRVKDLAEIVVDLTCHHMVNPSYPGIVTCLGGDIITGDIHLELSDTNDQYILPACLDVQDTIAGAIEHFADVFGRVFVPCVVGNHGRETLRPRFKGKVYTNYEWNIYCQLERYFRNDDRVIFMVPGEADAPFRVYNHRFHLTHGDTLGVKGGDGIIGALGPITRGAIKVGRSEAQIGRDFDTIVMGHWHQLIMLENIMVNGTLKGYDEFARLALRAPYQPASQALWFVHPKHGMTARWPIYLQKKATDNRPWVSWPEA